MTGFIQCICIHNCHMGKDCTIFLFAVCKSKHSSQIKFFFLEICVQTIATSVPVIQICICTFADCLYLLICGSTAHNGKYLTGKHHPHAVLRTGVISSFVWNCTVFYLSSVVVIISVKPSLVPILNPFVFPDVFHQPVCFFFQISAHLFQGKHNLISA